MSMFVKGSLYIHLTCQHRRNLMGQGRANACLIFKVLKVLKVRFSKNSTATRNIGQSRTLNKLGKLHHMFTFE